MLHQNVFTKQRHEAVGQRLTPQHTRRRVAKHGLRQLEQRAGAEDDATKAVHAAAGDAGAPGRFTIAGVSVAHRRGLVHQRHHRHAAVPGQRALYGDVDDVLAGGVDAHGGVALQRVLCTPCCTGFVVHDA